MLRFYLSNDSYPELREMRSRWQRHRAWWRAFGSAVADPRFWGFVAVEAVLFGAALGAGRLVLRVLDVAAGDRWIVYAASIGPAVAAGVVLAASWGGDLVRPHLRRTSALARASCPGCGYLLTGQLAQASSEVHCPECGGVSPRSAFEPPYRIPLAYRAFGGTRDPRRSGPAP